MVLSVIYKVPMTTLTRGLSPRVRKVPLIFFAPHKMCKRPAGDQASQRIYEENAR